RGHHGRASRIKCRQGAGRVDPKIVNDRFHCKWKSIVQQTLSLAHDRSDVLLELVMPVRGDEECHASARHSAEHQESPEVAAQELACLVNNRLCERVCHPGNDLLERSVPVASRQSTDRPCVGGSDGRDNAIKYAQALTTGEPSLGVAK